MDFDVVSRLLFPTPPSSYTASSFPTELLCVPKSLNPQTSSPSDCIPLLLLRCDGAHYLVIVFHSNSEDLGRCHSFCTVLRDRLQVHVLAVEYPGYGICPGGQCDERSAMEAARTAFRFAREVLKWPMDSIILFGRSIGTGLALALAAQHQVGGLILVSPFLSIKELGREKLGPMANIITERFPNQELMPLISSPCLIVHGLSDTMIPYRHGQRLHQLCPARKMLVLPADLEHNGRVMQNPEFLISPALEFFHLPKYGMEMQVPSWAFDSHLALLTPATNVGTKSGANDHVSLSGYRELGACKALGFSDRCSGPSAGAALGCRYRSDDCGHREGTDAESSGAAAPVRSRPEQLWNVNIVEETISNAIEQVLPTPRQRRPSAPFQEERVEEPHASPRFATLASLKELPIDENDQESSDMLLPRLPHSVQAPEGMVLAKEHTVLSTHVDALVVPGEHSVLSDADEDQSSFTPPPAPLRPGPWMNDLEDNSGVKRPNLSVTPWRVPRPMSRPAVLVRV